MVVVVAEGEMQMQLQSRWRLPHPPPLSRACVSRACEGAGRGVRSARAERVAVPCGRAPVLLATRRAVLFPSRVEAGARDRREGRREGRAEERPTTLRWRVCNGGSNKSKQKMREAVWTRSMTTSFSHHAAAGAHTHALIHSPMCRSVIAEYVDHTPPPVRSGSFSIEWN